MKRNALARANFENALKVAVRAAIADGLTPDAIIECLEDEAAEIEPRMRVLDEVLGVVRIPSIG